MTSRQRRSLRGSMDEVLEDLLGDDAEDLPLKLRSPTAGPGRPSGVFRTQSGRRNFLDEDFFSNLAEEAEKDDEGSDVSEADPKALLESMKDMDDMDAELFGLKKKPSSAPALSRTSGTETSKPGDKNKTNPAAGSEETKPSSAPAGTVRSYRKFMADDADNPLDDLLNDLEEERPKSAPSGKAGKQPTSSPAGQKKEERATPAPKKRNELTFEDHEDDLMDAMGFSDAPKGNGSGLVSKKDSEAPQRPRTRLDEILGIGTSPHLLDRPVTGAKKDATPAERPPQKSSASKGDKTDSVIGEEDVTFGSYQPTLASTPEGRNSRRHSVRFSTEDISSFSPERKPKSSTVTSTRLGRPASDWLGLKQDANESEKREEKEEPTRQRKESTGPSERLEPPPPSPSHEGGKASRVTSKPSEELRDVPGSPEPSATAAGKPELSKKEDEDDWLAGALSRKKALAEDRLKRQEESLGLGEEIHLDTFLSKRNTTPTPRRVKEDTPLPPTQQSRDSLVAASRQQSPAPAATPSTGVQHTHTHTHEPEQNPAAVSVAPVQQVALSTNGLQQLTQAQLWGLGTPLDLNSLQKQRGAAEPQTGDTTALQSRIIQLEGQVRSLQLEKDQLQMLLDNVQQRHKHDTELMENTHRARVKLLEESAVQREARAHVELQELTERLDAVIKQAHQERAELQEQHQRRLATSQQERDREVERLRQLQRNSILEMKKDYEEQVQRLRRLKDEEIDAVTSATSQTRSLTAVIEQMEQFSLRLGDLSSRIESTHENTTQGLELGARQRDQQLRVLQERLTQQQRDMAEERTRLKEVISKMDTQLAEQQRQLQQERWRVTAEQAKAESALRALEEERRTMMQQFTIEREEMERAKSGLLDMQQSVMQRCAEGQRKLDSEWTHFHAQEKLRKERDMDREGHIISIAQEQAELKLHAGELKQREELIQKEREKLEKLRCELEAERERLNAAALQLKHRAHEVESLSKLACERYDEGERALQEARQVEGGHQARLRSIRTELERLRTQEQSLQQERIRVTDHHREIDRTRRRLPTDHTPAHPLITGFCPAVSSTVTHLPASINSISRSVSPKLQATLAVLRHTAEKDRDFLQDEQFFLEALKQTACTSTLQT